MMHQKVRSKQHRATPEAVFRGLGKLLRMLIFVAAMLLLPLVLVILYLYVSGVFSRRQ
jgi:hypothetical protein